MPPVVRAASRCQPEHHHDRFSGELVLATVACGRRDDWLRPRPSIEAGHHELATGGDELPPQIGRIQTKEMCVLSERLRLSRLHLPVGRLGRYLQPQRERRRGEASAPGCDRQTKLLGQRRQRSGDPLADVRARRAVDARDLAHGISPRFGHLGRRRLHTHTIAGISIVRKDLVNKFVLWNSV